MIALPPPVVFDRDLQDSPVEAGLLTSRQEFQEKTLHLHTKNRHPDPCARTADYRFAVAVVLVGIEPADPAGLAGSAEVASSTI